MNIPEEGENKLTDAKLQGYAAVLAIGSTRCKANILGIQMKYWKIIFYNAVNMITLIAFMQWSNKTLNFYRS